MLVIAGIPGARFHLMEQASHGAPIQHTAWVNGQLAEHLAAAESRRSGA